jgi:endonuclease G, mitochondrial
VPPTGYDSTFLRLHVPLPILNDKQKADAARMLGTKQIVVPYTNFSLVMSKSRKIAYYTGVNIDGVTLQAITRASDRWQYDKRIDKAYQIGGNFYRGNDLDQGHLVRRLDPAWGAQARRAIIDTFTYTNCAPQHAKLNRDEWSDLEDYILKNTDIFDLRVSVFTGPVFRDSDPIYKDVRVPMEFWKVVVLVKKLGTGVPSATAYLQTQRNLLNFRDFEFGAFRMYQVKVSEIEALTKMTFADLSQYDPLARMRDATPVREIKSPKEVLL